jgi:hypothetical protein
MTKENKMPRIILKNYRQDTLLPSVEHFSLPELIFPHSTLM